MLLNLDPSSPSTLTSSLLLDHLLLASLLLFLCLYFLFLIGLASSGRLPTLMTLLQVWMLVFLFSHLTIDQEPDGQNHTLWSKLKSNSSGPYFTR